LKTPLALKRIKSLNPEIHSITEFFQVHFVFVQKHPYDFLEILFSDFTPLKTTVGTQLRSAGDILVASRTGDDGH
jgi:hypothetical protein